jgi:branched-chain amino acid aminotransferase
MKKKAYFNGRIIDEELVKISPRDIGFLRGYGVFDVMVTENRKPFLIKEHFVRLSGSAKELKLALPFDFKTFEKIANQLVNINNFNKSIIRTVITGGVSPDAFSPGKITSLIMLEKFKPLPKRVYEKGAKIITIEFQRECPLAKITNYVEAIKNQPLKKKKKAIELLYVKNGKILEFSTSNIFIVKKGILTTPLNNVLSGTTRNQVIKLAAGKYPVEKRDVKITELWNSDEVFLTATNKNIVPIVQVDGRIIGNGKVGDITKVMMKTFDLYCKSY